MFLGFVKVHPIIPLYLLKNFINFPKQYFLVTKFTQKLAWVKVATKCLTIILQFPHIKSTTNKWGNQFLNEVPLSWDSRIRNKFIYPLICWILGSHIYPRVQNTLQRCLLHLQIYQGLCSVYKLQRPWWGGGGQDVEPYCAIELENFLFALKPMNMWIYI